MSYSNHPNWEPPRETGDVASGCVTFAALILALAVLITLAHYVLGL